MKITKQDYADLCAMLDAHAITRPWNTVAEAYTAYTRGGFTQKRFRWDLLFSVPYRIRVVWFDRIYQYANDTHIDTAMKRYVAERTA